MEECLGNPFFFFFAVPLVEPISGDEIAHFSCKTFIQNSQNPVNKEKQTASGWGRIVLMVSI